MKTLFKAAILAAAPIAAVAALPQIASAQALAGIAVANPAAAVQRSNAFTTAMTQMKTTYKPQLDQFEARQKAIQAELQPLVTAFNTARAAPNANQQALQTQANTIQQRQQTAQQELQRIGLPVARAQAYVEEQIVAKLDAAIKAAMTKKRISLVLQPEAAVSYQPTVDITQDIVAELNTSIPSAGIVPPQGWEPGRQGQQAAAAPANPAPQPTGR